MDERKNNIEIILLDKLLFKFIKLFKKFALSFHINKNIINKKFFYVYFL